MQLTLKRVPVVVAMILAAAHSYAAPICDTSDTNSNTACGTDALLTNTTGSNNTATGYAALWANSTGSENTALGVGALITNNGNANTAAGYQSLYLNTGGGNNTASGYQASYSNRGGSNNTSSGYQALYWNDTGSSNAAFGAAALVQNRAGVRNTAVGAAALAYNRGNFNTALGYGAGEALTYGTDNIDIASAGVAGETHTLRLGTQGSSGTPGSGVVSTYIAGVASVPVTGLAVYITSSGQLGVQPSSERYKTDIESMGTKTERLAELRPVSFKYKNDPNGTVQYGLIAEEVAKVYPELVIRGDDGRINGVRYEELTPMLLHEVQQQQAQIAALNARLAELDELKQQMLAALHAK